jgi:hypothetical protein
MKKLFTSFAIAALCSISANAQNLQRNTPAAQNAQDVSPVNVPAPVVPTTTDQQQPTTPNSGTNNPRLNQKRDNLNAKWKQQPQEGLKQKPVNQNDRSQRGRNEGGQFSDNTKNMSPEERQRMMKAYEEKRGERKDERRDEKREEKREEAKEKWRSSSPEEKKEILKNKEEKLKEREAKIDARQEKLQNLSPEEKARMEKRQEMMSKLSPQQRDNLKKEQERHRQEMKKITGFDMEQNQNNSGERK